MCPVVNAWPATMAGVFCEDHLDLCVGQRLAIQCAEILRLADGPLAAAEALLPADKKGHFRSDPGVVLLQKTHQSTEMIVMPMA